MASYKVKEDVCSTHDKRFTSKSVRNSHKSVKKKMENSKEKWTKLVNSRAKVPA